MNFTITESFFLPDGTKRIRLKIAMKQLIYFGYILESFEGWCNFTTINKREHIIQVDVSPDFIAEMEKLIEDLKHWNV